MLKVTHYVLLFATVSFFNSTTGDEYRNTSNLKHSDFKCRNSISCIKLTVKCFQDETMLIPGVRAN